MGLELKSYIQKFLAAPGTNDAAALGVKIVSTAGADWRVIGVHHLSGAENVGNRNVYIEPVDAQGKRIPGCVAEYTWEGKRDDEPAPPTALDKPPGEVAGNIPISAGQVLTVWLRGTSDKVSGLTSSPDIPDTEGNTRYHNSYLVVFQRYSGTPAPTPSPSGDCAAHLARIAKLEATIKDVITRLESVIALLKQA
jgi:hypothetical protein